MKKGNIYKVNLTNKIKTNQKQSSPIILNDTINTSTVLTKSEKNQNINKNITVKQKLQELENRIGYIFNIKLIIKTKEKEYKTQIASIIQNTIITIDGNIININDIKEIIEL